jgi:hypothetical protein
MKLHLASWKLICKKNVFEVLESLIYQMLTFVSYVHGLKGTQKMMKNNEKLKLII